MIRVLVVDDHALVRAGLRELLNTTEDVRVVGEAADGEEALSRIAEQSPDVLLLDMRMPKLGGVEALERLARTKTAPATLMLTTFEDGAALARAVRAGARGFLTKHATAEELTSAIRAVAAGKTYFKAVDGAPAICGEIAKEEPYDPLTSRELEVLRLISRGLSNKEIAVALGIADGTVKNVSSNILSKLGVADRTRAALRALELGLFR